MKTLTLLISIFFILSGCSKEDEHKIKNEISVKTVQYYIDHEDLRNVRLKECKLADKLSLIEREDCKNVQKASMDKQMSTMPKWDF